MDISIHPAWIVGVFALTVLYGTWYEHKHGSPRDCRTMGLIGIAVAIAALVTAFAY